MKAKVHFDGHPLPDINIVSYEYSYKERLTRSLKTFFIWFGITIVSVLIPVLHFIVVPLFLILSFYFTYRKVNEEISVDLRDIKCPSCKKNLSSTIKGLRKKEVDLRLFCYDCRKNLSLILSV